MIRSELPFRYLQNRRALTMRDRISSGYDGKVSAVAERCNE